MPNYLTKEEIRQWRGSLEKITLEEFAARLGKQVEESKPTNDVVDIVMSKGTSSNTSNSASDSFSKIAERAFARERQISHTPFSINKKDLIKHESDKNEKVQSVLEEIDITVNKALKTKCVKQDVKNAKNKVTQKSDLSVIETVKQVKKKKNDSQIILKKSLTDREQMVFEYFLNNIGKTVYAKDLAELLDLPRDYIYKYIKNLRAKIDGEKLKNVPSGGFILEE